MDAMTDRGQAFTLEAVLAAVVLLATVAFVLHVAGVTGNTPSTADAGIEDQNRGLADGALDSAVSNESLRPTLLFWNESEEAFHETDEEAEYYVSRSPPTEFGEVLDRTFDGFSVKYNVDVYYAGNESEVERQRLIHHGTPTDDAVRATTTVTLHDDDPLYDANETARNVTVSDLSTDNETEGEFYASKAGDGSVYNVLRVEVVVWRA